MIKSDVLTFGGGGESAVIKCTGDVLSTDTVVATKGGVSKSGRWVTDHFEIGVAEYGTYSVTATRGTKTSTYSVNVDSLDEYDVTIAYRIYLYNEGDECESVTGGWSFTTVASTTAWYFDCSGGGTRTQTKNASNFYIGVSRSSTIGYPVMASICTANALDLTSYSKIKIEGHYYLNTTTIHSSENNYHSRVGILNSAIQGMACNAHIPAEEVAMTKIVETLASVETKDADFSNEIDLSLITGNKYIAVYNYAYRGSNVAVNTTINKIWLE